MNRDFSSVDDYIDAQPDATKTVLHTVRAAIRKALPRAEEGISYKMPVYRLAGERVLFFAGWKRHFSLYPAGERLVARFKRDLAPYEITRGTIRFPLSDPVPVKLIEDIARFRAKEAGDRGSLQPRVSRKSKTGAKRKERSQ